MKAYPGRCCPNRKLKSVRILPSLRSLSLLPAASVEQSAETLSRRLAHFLSPRAGRGGGGVDGWGAGGIECRAVLEMRIADENESVLATRPRPRYVSPPPRKKCEGSGAPNRRTTGSAHAQTSVRYERQLICCAAAGLFVPSLPRLRGRVGRGPLAFRRSATALASASERQTQSRPRFARTGGCRRYPHHRSRLSQAPGTPVVMPEGHSICISANCVLFVTPRPPENGLRIRPQEPHSLHLQDRI